ncbi:terpene cyclase/mutase family protein [Stieleria sp. TO1_6]|uniref:prenyltransferase/squalene oxidase repeat-containing protein n=1 Tax=Stieleria tagensis TaxID=2956795 RepID=UPI00209A71AF|nr:prenyltransferase/squalene oxidase repeat-containing protein [Stieleria tagensis]MCO8120152.1 terpene cyclase/mutase family protein [Stieleria tagensis]
MIWRFPLFLLVWLWFGGPPHRLHAQSPTIGEMVSRDAQQVYAKGLEFLARTQDARGTWPAGESVGPGTTGMAVLAFLASGEDPNFGPHREVIRKGLRHIIGSQSSVTGYMGPSMYHHGFATLALCEAYGSVDDTDLFTGARSNSQRSLGAAVELAVRSALTSQQQNRKGGWRYAPNASDADTSVSGAVMMGLLAARNAGIEVPDEAVDRAIAYFIEMTASDGTVGYTGATDGGGQSIARSSIVNLVLAIARRKDLDAYDQTTRYIVANQDADPNWPEYARYYQAQALFQSDVEVWKQWNERLIRVLKREQQDDGSFKGDLGVTNSTSMTLLALAVNFRFLPIYER